jgi:hypothetical protein
MRHHGRGSKLSAVSAVTRGAFEERLPILERFIGPEVHYERPSGCGLDVVKFGEVLITFQWHIECNLPEVG